MDQTAVAAGDFQNTADSLPNTMKRVQASAEEALTSLGAPLLAPLADAASMLADNLAPLEPILGSMGETMGDLIGPMSTMVQGMIDGLLPALDAGTEFVSALVDELGPELEEWANENGAAFADLGESLAELIGSASALIPVIADVTGFFLDMASAGFEGAGMLADMVVKVTDLSTAMGPFGGVWGGFTSGAGEAVESGGGFADMVDEASDAAGGLEAPVGAAADALIEQGAAAETAEDRLDAWSRAVEEAFGGQLDIVGATEAFEASIDKVTESIMLNGQTIDTNTAKGRENSETLRSAAEDALKLAEAYAGEGKYEEAQTVLAGTRERIIEAGTAAGASREQMELYLAALGLTPEKIETTLDVLGIPENEAALEHVTRDRTTLAMAKHYGADAVDRYLNVVARPRDANVNARANGLAWVEGQLAHLTRPRWVEIHPSIGPAPPGFNNAESQGGRRTPAGRSTVGLLDRPIHTQVNIDGKRVAEAVVRPLAIENARQNGGRR
jgi:hypothetical protein